jgi:hypothetical protein
VDAQERAGNAETAESGDAGSDPLPVGASRPIGVSLSELEAMTLDPLEESRRAGIDVRVDPPYGMTSWRDFVKDSDALSWWLQDVSDESRPAIPGFVVEYRQWARAENMSDDSKGNAEREKYRQLLSASVLAFDSRAHAREYVDWLPTVALDRADKPARAELEAAGKGAVIWRSGSEGHFLDVSLIPRGNLVGQVVTRGFKTDGHRGTVKPLARALAERMTDVAPHPHAKGTAGVLAAPLPSEAWAALGDDRSTYPKLITCDQAVLGDCFGMEPMWENGAPPEDSSALYLVDAQALTDEEREYPVVGTELIAHASQSEATDAMGKMVSSWAAREGGWEFPVPGISGAVGVRTSTLSDGVDGGFTFSVFFTHGSTLARAFVAGGPKDWGGDGEDPGDWDRNLQWAIDAARAWDARLDEILG